MIYNPCEGQGADEADTAKSALSQHLAPAYGLNVSQNDLVEKWKKWKDKKKSFDLKCIGLNQVKLDKLLDEQDPLGYKKRVWCCKVSLGCNNPNYTDQETCEQSRPKGATGPVCKWFPGGRQSLANFKSHECGYDDSQVAHQAYLDNFQCDHLCDDSLLTSGKHLKKSHQKMCCRVQKKHNFCASLIPASVTKPPSENDPYMSKPLDVIQFNCSSGMRKPWKWLAIKRRWCYSHWGMGVLPKESTRTITTSVTTTKKTSTVTTTSTTPGIHDCYTGVEDWVESFPYVKKVYCCKFWERRENWPEDTRAKCCDYMGFGCKTTIQTTSKPYDCHAGYFNWIKGWSPNKKVYCCRTEGRGCIFDCSADYHHGDWRQEWSMAKKAWCCLTEGRGCADDTQPAPQGAYQVQLV